MPLAAVAASTNQRSVVKNQKPELNKAAADDVFAKPLDEKSSSSLPAPRAESAPQPLAPPPAVSDITATLTATITATANNADNKADPGDTISYVAKLTSSGAGGTGLSFSNPLDAHTTLVPGSLNSTPVAFDQSVTTNEDNAVNITIQGQDPDGSNLTFKNAATGLAFGATTTLTHGTLGAFSAPSCNVAGVCSSTATYTPTANDNGSDSFSFKVNDGTSDNDAGTNGLVSITINSVNDVPTFTPGANQTVNEDAGAQTVNSFITNVSPGPANESGQTVTFPITNTTHTALFVAQPQINVSGNTATLSYTPAVNANGTSTITYHAHDNGGTANGGVDTSSPDQSFTITVNAVNDAPSATAKAFSVQANMKITGLSGLLTGATDPDATNGTNDPNSFDAAYTPTFTVLAGSVVPGGATPCAATGTVSNLNTSNGTFDYDPPPGFAGTCTLVYQVTDSGYKTPSPPGPGATSAQATITMTVGGPVIWFVQTTANPSPPAGAAGDGRLSNPFNRLDSAMTAMGVNANQRIFVFTGSTPTVAGQTVTLAGNNTQASQALARVQAQWLIGQGVVAANFDTFFGILPPANTIARPTLGADTTGANALRPTIQGTVTMKENTVVQGLNINTSAGGTKGITASGLAAGTSGSLLTIKDVNVTSAAGNAVDIAGGSPTNNSVEYTTSDAASFPISIASTTGIALSVVNTTIGPNGLNFKSVSANGGPKGIVLNNTGAGPLNIVGTGTTAGSGGTIQTTTSNGIELKTAQNITLKNMTITGNGTSQTVAGSSSSCGGDLATGNNLSCVANIYMQTVTNASFDRLSVTNSKQQGINGNAVNGLSITNSTITGNGDEGFEDGVLLQNQSGTFTFTGNTVTDNRAGQLYVANLSGAMTLNASSSTIGRTGAGTADAQQSVLLHLMGTSNSTINATTLTMNNNFFVSGTNVYTNAFQLNADNGSPTVTGHLTSSSLDKYAAGVFVNAGGTANVTFDVMNNATMTHGNLQAINYTILGGGAGITANITGTISGNTINGCEPVGSNCHGIDFNAGENHNGEFHIKVDQNDIQGTGSGILMLAGGAAAAGTAKAHLKITRNTIHNPGFATGRAAIELQAAITSANPNISICTDIGGSALQNVISGAWSTGSSQSGIFLRQRFSAANSWILPGYVGPANNSGQQVEAYLNGRNTDTATPFTATATTTTGAYVTGSCTTPLQLASGGVESNWDSIFATPASTLNLNRIAGLGQSSVDSLAVSAHEFARPAVATVSPVTNSLSQDQLDSIVTAAMARWSSTGLSEQQLNILRGLTFEVARLQGSYLGDAEGSHVLVDPQAQGKGWFVDGSPASDLSFASFVSATRRYTNPAGVPAGHVDLLTAIEHEMGHKLGLDDLYAEKDRDNLMYGYLTVGERRIPAKGQAAKAKASNAVESHFLSLISEDQIRALPPQTGSRTEDAAERVNGSQSFSLNMRVVSVMSGESGVVAEIRGQKSKSISQKSEARDQNVRLNHAAKAEIRGQKSEVRNHIAGVAFVVPTPVGSFPINGTGTGQGFTLPAGKTTTITFKATLNAPPNLSGPSNPKVSAQATLTGTFVGNPLLTDDTVPPNGTDPTVTNVDLYDSTTTISASPSNSTNTSQAVTFTATIGTSGTPNGSATNRTGTVNFRDNGVSIGCDSQSVSHVGSNDVATCTISTLTTGVHNNITAAYSGDGNFDPSTSSAFTQTVSKSGTNATLVSSLNPATVTQNVTFTISISSATSVPGPPTGTVTFKDGASTIGCTNAGGQALNGSGVATCQTSSLSATSHTITADYPGDSNFNANNGIALTASGGQNGNPQVVNKATPSVTLVSSLNPAFVGQTVTFTGTVSAPGGISGTPSGSLTFKDGAGTITCLNGGGPTLNGSGVGTCQVSNLSAGSHTITVDYGGDSSFNVVNGTGLTANGGQNGNPQVINQSNTTMTVSSNNNPSKVTESVTFAVNIKSSNLAQVPGPPTGNVKFWDGAIGSTQIGATKALGTVGCADASSACVNSDATTSLTAGTHTITVEYVGDSNFTANSANLSGGQVVNKSDTSVNLQSSGLTPNVGDPVTFTATISVSAPSLVAFDNNGTVAFKDGSNVISGCGSQPLVASQATCNTNALPAGARNITAVYGGDGAFNGSTSNTVVQQVGPACPSSVVVMSNGDNGAGTLRQALIDVCDGGTITFDSTVFPAPGPNFINLIDAGGAGVGGELLISKNVTINGPAASILTVRRDPVNATTDFRVFEIASGKTVTISGMTISNGKASGVSPANLGGAIYNDHGTLTLTNSVVSGNTADVGGAIDNNGVTSGSASLTISNTTISGNIANTFGGGIYNNGLSGGSATLNIDKSTISGNNAGLATDGSGGGINNNGAATLTITNSTFSGNKAGAFGGGIFSDGGPATLTSVTITGNTADNDNNNVGAGGGLRRESGTFTLRNTIVAGNFKGVGSGVMQQETGTVVGSITSGTQQQNTLHVTLPNATSGTGDVSVILTAPGMTGTPKNVPVTLSGDEAAGAVATDIKNKLNLDSDITSFFVITTSGPDVILTRTAAADDDTNIELSITGCTCNGAGTGVDNADSTDTTPGLSSGNAQVIITSADLPGGTKTFNVPVAKPDTQDDVASKMRAALATDTDVNTKFSVTGSTNQIVLMRLISAPNDSSLNIETKNGTCTGLTDTTPSADTTGGVAAASANDISGTADASSSYSLIGDSASAGGLTNGTNNNIVGVADVNTVLDPNLANNGGPTRTHKLATNSPAIDAGNAFTLITDQRGLQRPVDLAPANASDGSDIGAYEQQGATPVPTLTLASTNIGGTTRDNTPDFSAGNLIVGATVELLRGGVSTTPATLVTATSATMSLTDNTLTTDGTYSYTVKQTVGIDSQTSTPALSVTVDTRPSTPDLLTADDTFGAGTAGTDVDNITKITTPRFTGGAPTDPNTTIQLFANGNPVGSTTSDGSGLWTITSSALAPGTYSITAKEVIGSFVGAASTALSPVVIDTAVSPAASAPVLLPADDTGTTGDNTTNIKKPRLTGTAEANSSVQLFVGINVIGSGTTDGSGNWTIQPTNDLADNTYQVTAQATDLAGNVSPISGALTLVIDTAAPGPPSQPDLITGDDTGAFNNDNVTSKTTPTFTGTAEANSNVQLFANSGGGDVLIGSATATGGTWSITSSALTANTYQITAKASDAAGNTSNASPILSVTIDTQAPNAPSPPDLIAADDTGASPTDNITKKTTPTFTGSAEANSTVQLFADSGGGAVQVGSGPADGSGNWSILSSALSDGTYQITAKATDLAGNQSVASTSLQVVIDTHPPVAPSTPVLNPADDTGTSNSDGITKKNNPNFTGTAEAGSTVVLFAGATPAGSGVATGGNWSITSSILADNSYNVTAQATDLAGNTSSPSGPFALVIDTVKPTVTMSSAVGNPTATTPIPVTVQFSEPVSGFTLSDIVPSNGTVGNFAGSSANYSFDLTPTAAGGVSAGIAADIATDTAGNGNTAAVQFNRTYDPSALNATITPISPNPRNTSVSSIQIVFNKAVTGFDLSDLTLKLNNGANLLTGAQTLTSADNATWTLGNLTGLTTAEGTYDLKLTASGSNIQDATNTPLASDATASWVMDTTAPTVTVEQVGPDPVTGPTGTTIINFTATFSEPVTGLTPSGVTLFGTANPTIVNVTGSGAIYNLAVQGMNQSGTVRASINPSAAQDSAGNGNAASTSVDNTVQFNADNFSTLEVNSIADTDDGHCDALGTGSGNQDCTLREAINAANADTGAETITFAPALTSGGPATIKLLTALPNISTDMTIQGPGANVLTVMRSDVGVIPRFRVFTITAGTVTISGLTVSNGATASGTNGVAGGVGTDGGGIANAGALTLSAVTVTGNSAGSGGNSSGANPGGNGGSGGGVSNNGTLVISNSTISANNAGTGGDGLTGGSGGSGGGIYHSGAGTLTITNSTISGNQAGVGGNPSGVGGSGGGIGAAANLTLTSCTLTLNNAPGSGGGLARTAGVTTIQNSIVGGNTATASAPDISGTVQSDGFNLIQSTSGATINQNGGAGPNITGQDPLLNALADNGGPTFTHSLQCSSPAIDKGKAFGAPPDSTRDQRGLTRPFDFADAVYPNAVGGDGSDIGAYETQSAGGCVPTAIPPAVQPTTTSEDTPVQITLTGTYSQNINLTFSITQSPTNGALGPISAPNCTFTSSMTCTATVTYTPAANASGGDLFKFKVSASGLDSDPADVTVSVSSVNDPPTFGITSNHTVNEDAGPQVVNNFAFNISPGAANESSQQLQFIVTGNTNPGLFSASPAIDSSGTLTYTSAANANGQATITVVLKDDGGTANGGNDTSTPKTFTIIVNSVNDAPSFALAGNQTVLEDAGPQTVANFATAISVGPPQESGQTAQFIITNNTNAGLFSSAPAISPTGTLTYTPAPDANGSATITVVLKDNGGTLNGGVDTSAPQTFTINVTSVNDAPTLDALGDRTINEDAPTQTVNLAGINAGGGEVQVLTVTATSNNPALIPNPTVNYTSPSATGSISFTPLADQNGTAIISVTVNDGGGTANGGVQTVTRTFNVTVNAVNDAPVNNLPGPQTTAENTPLTFSTANANLISITDVDSGANPVRVTLTATSGVITLSTTAGLAFTVGDGTADPTMTFTGTLASINTALQGMTFTPLNGFSGAAALQIITNDQGNTGSGGPLSDTDTLSITVNDGGNLQFSAATYTVSENAGPAVITITRTAGSAGTATVQIATSNGTATAGSDYTAVTQTVTFNSGETSKTVNIPIIDDLLNEPDETVNLTLSSVGGSGALGTPSTAVLTIADDDPAGGYIKFSSPTYSVAEGGVATITVQRQGTLTQPVTVMFATSDDSDPASMVMCAPTPGNTLASSRCDFTSAFGRITFAAGDGADKTFKVLTTQDSYLEGPETFTVTLSNPTNSATLALPSTATVTITDDAIEPPTNPVDDSNAFVEQLYRDFLNRPADPAGKAFWVNNIDHCNDPAQRPAGQTAAQCIELSRIVTAAAFFLSIEFQATGGTAYLTNKAAFGSRPNFARFEQDAQRVGLNYVFGQPGAEALLEANKVAYYNDYVTRTDFVNTYGGVSDQTYVNTLITNTGVAFTQAEHDAFVNGLANQSETRATVLRKISEKGTFRAAEFNSMFVLMEYYGFLRRNPDTGGFNFWLGKLNLFNGNYLDAEMVKAFIESNEYRQRFGP